MRVGQEMEFNEILLKRSQNATVCLVAWLHFQPVGALVCTSAARDGCARWREKRLFYIANRNARVQTKHRLTATYKKTRAQRWATRYSCWLLAGGGADADVAAAHGQVVILTKYGARANKVPHIKWYTINPPFRN